MSYKRILTAQDISCVGQCSLTVALPIISAMGIETAILPSAVLSTHTYKFSGYTFCDLTEEMPAIAKHWKDCGITFDGIYTGYIGNVKQFDVLDAIINDSRKTGGLIVIDPVMGDNGVFYPGFDKVYAKRMALFCGNAQVLLPNLTEACFLTDTEFKDVYDKAYIETLVRDLAKLGAENIVLTGVSFTPDKLGVAVYNKNMDCTEYYFSERIDKNFHGTGDIYSSCFVGGYVKGLSVYDAAALAVDYTVECIKASYNDDSHWYGAEFELAIPYLVERLKQSSHKS